MFTRHYVQTPAVEPVYRSSHLSIEGPGLAAMCEGRAHTDSLKPEFRCSRQSVVGPQVAQSAKRRLCDLQLFTHVCLVAPVALPPATQILEIGHVLQWRVAADDHLVEGCLSCASLARLDSFVGQGATRDRCVRPSSHQHAMCIFRPRSLVNSRVHDSHLCTRLSFATSASVVALVRVVLWMCIILLFLAPLAEMIIAASAMEPAASDVIHAVACPASSSMRAASSAYSNFAIRTVCAPVATVVPGFT